MSFSLPSVRRGFTLLEMLVVMAVLAILAMILVPQVIRFVERARTAECASRLRWVGSHVLAYCTENNGELYFFRDGSGSKMWFNSLRDYLGYSTDEAQKHFACPSLPIKDSNGGDLVGSWYCYGMRLSGKPGKVVRPSGGGVAYYSLSLAAVENPDSFLLMADTITSSGARQTFRIIPPGLYSGSGIHTRHEDMANVFFLDGHVESLTAEGLAKVGVSTTLSAELKQIGMDLEEE